MKLIVLASKSPRRKALLKQLGLNFVVVPSSVEEKFNTRLKPKGQAEALSLLKAEAVVKEVMEKKSGKDALILGADTIVAIGEEVFRKPKDEKEAKRILRRLSGKMHRVITAFTIIDTVSGRKVTRSVETLVYFKKLNELEIHEYVKREKLTDKAGAYAIQGLGAVFIEKIEGDYFNVVGLPLYALALELRKFGVKIL